MKPINYYSTPKTQYLSRADIKKQVFKDFENFVGTQAQINERKKELEQQVTDRFRENQRQRNDELNRLNQEFKNDLAEEHGVVGNPKLDKLYSIAWDYGHSSGHQEVVSYFENLVDLID